MTRVGLYPGSFDPLTNGHLDMLRAAFGLFDKVVVAIGVHPSKTPLFPAEQRAKMILEAAMPLAKAAGSAIEVRQFSGLVTAFAREAGASALIRGVRDGADLDYEMPMAGMNGVMAPGLQTVFLPATPATRHITATLVRQVAAMGGDVTAFVPENVKIALSERFPSKR